MALTGADSVDPVVAHIACSTFAFLYVAGFYVFRSPDVLKLSRDHPQVIKARIRSVAVASIVILFIVWLIIPKQRQHSFLSLLGILPPHPITGTLGPLLLTIILFFGPLVQRGYEHSLLFQSGFNFHRDAIQVFTSLMGQRNFVVAPVTEEFVFRACVISVLYYARFSKSYLIFVSPMYFGLAHLHHIVENYRQYGANKRALKMAVFNTAFQFVYTTVFGWFVSFVFLRTANVWSPILCHVFCNLMGFPRVEDIGDRKPTERKVIWSAYVAGAVLFFWCLYPLTSPVGVGSLYWIQ